MDDNGSKKFDHDGASVVDALRLIGELEHMRFHLLMAAASGPEDKMIPPIVLASQCQDIRRSVTQRHFPDVENRYWCVVKSAARMLQILEEIEGDDIDELKDTKHIVDEAILLATGEDISGCESCDTDRQNSEKM